MKKLKLILEFEDKHVVILKHMMKEMGLKSVGDLINDCLINQKNLLDNTDLDSLILIKNNLSNNEKEIKLRLR